MAKTKVKERNTPQKRERESSVPPARDRTSNTRSAKKRVRKCPGAPVTLIKPSPQSGTWWRATYIDPDREKRVYETLPRELTTEAMRLDWRDHLSKGLSERKRALAAGAPKRSNMPIPEAIEKYFTGHPQLRPATVALYRGVTSKFVAWAAGQRIKTADDLSKGHVVEWAAHLKAEPKHSAVELGRRGRKMPIAEARSPHTVNRDLKITKRILRYLIDLEVCTRITHDDLRRALKPITAPVDRKEFLRPDEIRALLEAALEHDAATFAATRAELEGRRQRGTTYRHDPIAPFVLFLLLSGMRRGEALGLQWKDVSLDAVDDLGKPVGEIYIGKQSKTHQARTVSLDVAPSIRRLLSAMRLQSGGGMGAVFGITKGEAIAAMQRLRRPVPKQKNDPHGYGAPPKFTYQVLRVTASTFQTNAGAFGGSAAHISASRCGHSIETAQKHYAGLLRGVPRDLTTLEAMMQIEDLADAIVDSVATGVRALPKELRAG